jgi:F-box interacting protein
LFCAENKSVSMKRVQRDTQIHAGLIQLLLTRSSEVSFLSLNSDQASAIYSDIKVMNVFEFKMWISMSKLDDVIKSEELGRALVGKRFLLVIDNDVWNHNKDRNMLFKKLSTMTCKQGSKVILISFLTEISDLPDSVLQKILSKLPIRTIRSCECVNKEWNKLIKDPNFPRLHFAQQATVYPIMRTIKPKLWPSYFHMIEVNNTTDLEQPLKLHSKLLPPREVPKFGIVNSCNGLPFNNPACVWNPITGEYILIPKPERNPDTNNYIMDQEEKGESYYKEFVVSGFGFSQKDNQYRVMRAFGLVEEGDIYSIIVQVWTLGSKKWQTLGVLDRWREIGLKVTSSRQAILPIEARYRQSFCVYMNGAVHWLATRSCMIYICSFNFDQEKIIEISPPDSFNETDVDNHSIRKMRLGVLHDCLYVGDTSCYANFELWVLKDYNDDNFSWTKEVVINNLSLNIRPRGLYRPIKYLDNGDLLMFHPSNALVCYNPKEKSIRYFKMHEADLEFEMIPHIPSLIPMKDVINMEGSQVEILNVR